jgi:hypothetical protein
LEVIQVNKQDRRVCYSLQSFFVLGVMAVNELIKSRRNPLPHMSFGYNVCMAGVSIAGKLSQEKT